jgi:FkbM family methyltransferase
MLWLKLFLAKCLANPLTGRLLGLVYGDTIPCRGLSIHCPPSVPSSVRAMLFWGFYESAEMRCVRAFLRPGSAVVELGSSIGAVASLVASTARPARLVCVEANPRLGEAIRRNLDVNAPEVQAVIRHAAIAYDGIVDGMCEFYLGDTNLGSSCHAEGGAGVRVPALGLSELLRQEGIAHYALIMDIEGAEVGIMLRDPDALAGCRQIIAELHAVHLDGRDYAVEDVARLIIGLGFAQIHRDGMVFYFAKE